jgi:hypothetical protein
MMGEAENSAMSAAISVRSGDSVRPISRRRPTAMTSTVSTVKKANSGTLRTVTAAFLPEPLVQDWQATAAAAGALAPMRCDAMR